MRFMCIQICDIWWCYVYRILSLCMHFNTGKQKVTPQKTPSFTTIFANTLIAIAEQDRSVCAITAAMPGGEKRIIIIGAFITLWCIYWDWLYYHIYLGTGIDKFGKRFPKRTFDVGIAEQHGVTFAAGMAVEGLKPFCAIYSTFMQRAYDQVIHDVALQQLPVRMILDRAGLYLCNIYNFWTRVINRGWYLLHIEFIDDSASVNARIVLALFLCELYHKTCRLYFYRWTSLTFL